MFCLSADVGEAREQTLEMIFIESVMHLAHSLGSRTLQTAAIAQMWREEAITRAGINRSGGGAAGLSPGGCGSSRNRLGAVVKVGREIEEYMNGRQERRSVGYERWFPLVCGQWSEGFEKIHPELNGASSLSPSLLA